MLGQEPGIKAQAVLMGGTIILFGVMKHMVPHTLGMLAN